jgi:hypothetical protein
MKEKGGKAATSAQPLGLHCQDEKAFPAIA